MMGDRTDLPDIDDDDLATRLETMPDDVRDGLPFGTVKLAADGTVVVFGRQEAAQSGLAVAKAVGRNWFRDVAPCMDTPTIRTQLGGPPDKGPVDIAFDHTGDFRDPRARLHVRMMQTDDLAHVWIAIARV